MPRYVDLDKLPRIGLWRDPEDHGAMVELRDVIQALRQAEAQTGEVVPIKWIDVCDRLPEPETDVLICAERKYLGGGFHQVITIAMYENGTTKEKDSCYIWDDLDEFGIYDEEEDCYRIPEGWWECHQFSDCYDNKIDDKVTHWMPLPECKMGKEDENNG